MKSQASQLALLFSEYIDGPTRSHIAGFQDVLRIVAPLLRLLPLGSEEEIEDVAFQIAEELGFFSFAGRDVEDAKKCLKEMFHGSDIPIAVEIVRRITQQLGTWKSQDPLGTNWHRNWRYMFRRHF